MSCVVEFLKETKNASIDTFRNKSLKRVMSLKYTLKLLGLFKYILKLVKVPTLCWIRPALPVSRFCRFTCVVIGDVNPVDILHDLLPDGILPLSGPSTGSKMPHQVYCHQWAVSCSITFPSSPDSSGPKQGFQRGHCGWVSSLKLNWRTLQLPE